MSVCLSDFPQPCYTKGSKNGTPYSLARCSALWRTEIGDSFETLSGGHVYQCLRNQIALSKKSKALHPGLSIFTSLSPKVVIQ